MPTAAYAGPGTPDYDPVFYYYHPDHLGSSQLMTDRDGDVVQQYGYSPFGREDYKNNTLAFSVSNRYTGQTLDEETGLYYCGARYYDPELARFIQADSTVPDPEFSQAYNRYAYCYNNPLKFSDPTGQFPFAIAMFIAAYMGGFQGAAQGGVRGFFMGALLGAATAALSGAVGMAVGGWVGGGTAGAIAGTVAGTAASYALRGVVSGDWHFTVMDAVNLAIAVWAACSENPAPGTNDGIEEQHTQKLLELDSQANVLPVADLGLQPVQSVANLLAVDAVTDPSDVDYMALPSPPDPFWENLAAVVVAEVEGFIRGAIDGVKMGVFHDSATVQEYGSIGTASNALGYVSDAAGVAAGGLKLAQKGLQYAAKGSLKTALSQACFTGDTLVCTVSGAMPICQIELGDLVCARDPETGMTNTCRVIGTSKSEVQQLIVLGVGDEEIRTTAEHPFWVIDRGWTKVKDLRVGDHLQTLDGGKSAIRYVVVANTPADVYNIEVAGLHTYFVAKAEVLVHNKPLSNVRTLQTGGHTLKKGTLKALGLSKGQGKAAMEALKFDAGLPPKFHQAIIRSDGAVLNSHTREVIGNLYDYVY
jgi:RHS repeat-associated protein